VSGPAGNRNLFTLSTKRAAYGARNAAIWSSSTGSGRTRRASSAISGNPVLRSVEAKCCLEYCLV